MLNFFKKKNETPHEDDNKINYRTALAIETTDKNLNEDLLAHKIMLKELKTIMLASNRFLPNKIQPIIDFIDKQYVPMRSIMGNKKVMENDFFKDALADNITSSKESNFLMMVKLAWHRARNMVQIKDWESTIYIAEAEIFFIQTDIKCPNVLSIKSKYERKKIPLAQLPILPLVECYGCSRSNCHAAFLYKPLISFD